MRRKIFVYSNNLDFLDCFSAYVMESVKNGYDFSFFTERSLVDNALKQQQADLLLAEEDFLQKCDCPVDCIKVIMSNRTQVDRKTGRHEVNIYQRGRDILADMEKLIGIAGGAGMEKKDKTQKIVAFYSPQGGVGKTTLAYSLALLCARKHTSIYLNLEEAPYTDHLYQTTFHTGMEDVLYAIKDHRDTDAVLSNAMEKDCRNVTTLPVFAHYQDYQDLTGDETETFIESLLAVSRAEYIFIDLPGGLTGQSRRILEMSDVSFWIFEDTAIGKGKMEKVQSDHSIQRMAFFNKTRFVQNKCKVRGEDSAVIRIPFSDSLSKGMAVDAVLSGNQDFYNGCLELINMVDGGK